MIHFQDKKKIDVLNDSLWIFSVLLKSIRYFTTHRKFNSIVTESNAWPWRLSNPCLSNEGDEEAWSEVNRVISSRIYTLILCTLFIIVPNCAVNSYALPSIAISLPRSSHSYQYVWLPIYLSSPTISFYYGQNICWHKITQVF